MNILVVFPLSSRSAIRASRIIVRYLKQSNCTVFCEDTHLQFLFSFNPKSFSALSPPSQRSHSPIDLVISVGDDTTAVHAASFFPDQAPPILAFSIIKYPNFIASWSMSNYTTIISSVLSGHYSTCFRTRLHVDIFFNSSSSTSADRSHTVLSDFVIDRGTFQSLCNLECFCDGHFVATFQGDGVVFATPTGSPYYSADAGGPILHPSVPAIVMTPICPHSLSFRPLVLPQSSTIEIIVSANSRHPVSISFDGGFRQPLNPGDKVRITSSKYSVRTVCWKTVLEDWMQSLNVSCCIDLVHLHNEVSGLFCEEEQGLLEDLAAASKVHASSASDPLSQRKLFVDNSMDCAI
ncbi:hypothetical protein GEMRC1_002549 [Eukaryota sp. GEM-RC1]